MQASKVGCIYYPAPLPQRLKENQRRKYETRNGKFHPRTSAKPEEKLTSY
jgi:hypothetical protein